MVRRPTIKAHRAESIRATKIGHEGTELIRQGVGDQILAGIALKFENQKKIAFQNIDSPRNVRNQSKNLIF